MIGQSNYFGFGFYDTQLKTALWLRKWREIGNAKSFNNRKQPLYVVKRRGSVIIRVVDNRELL